MNEAAPKWAPKPAPISTPRLDGYENNLHFRANALWNWNRRAAWWPPGVERSERNMHAVWRAYVRRAPHHEFGWVIGQPEVREILSHQSSFNG